MVTILPAWIDCSTDHFARHSTLQKIAAASRFGPRDWIGPPQCRQDLSSIYLDMDLAYSNLAEGKAVAELSSAAINDLPDSAFAFIESGGTKDSGGRTTPRSKRHFPVHDEAHTRNALSRASQSPFGKQAMSKILAAARKFGIKTSAADRAFGGEQAVEGYPERRFTKFPLELRAHPGGDGPTQIWGYAACFDKLSRRLGGFQEQVHRSAFNTSKAEGYPNVVCRYNHKDDYLLGTTGSGHLQLGIDETGLRYHVTPPQARKDILELVERRDIQHSSFAFRVYPGGDEWGVSEFNGYPMRTLLDVELIDVAPVLDPAYPDATAGARAMDGAIRSLAQWVQAEPDEVRSRLAENRGMEFFRRTDNIGPSKRQQPKPKTMTGALALLALLDNREDPWASEL